MEDIYDLTNFNLRKDPLLTFIVKKENNEMVIQCNDNIIGSYNQYVSEHDITDIINQLLYEKNMDIKDLCFVMGFGDFISVKTDIKSYDNINRHTVIKNFKTIALYFYHSCKYSILKCFIMNYKLEDMAHYMMRDEIRAKHAHIVAPEYDEEDEIDNDSINVSLYLDLINRNDNKNYYISNKLIDVKEHFIKNIKFTSNDNKYIISCKLFKLDTDYYRLYVCMIYNIELDKSPNVCFFNHNNKFTRSNDMIRIKENDKYINILNNTIFIDLTEYNSCTIYKSYINYNITDED